MEMFKEHWGSLKQYLWRTITAGWALAGGVLIGGIVAAINHWIKPIDDSTAWIIGGLVVVIFAPYQAFHSLWTETRLMMPSELEGDWPIRAAVIAIGNIYADTSGAIDYGEVVRDLHQQAANGRIAVWGRQIIHPDQPNPVIVRPETLIPSVYWLGNEIDYNSTIIVEASRTRPSGGVFGGAGVVYFYDLSVNRKQIGSWWPHTRLSFRERFRAWLLRHT